MLSKATKKEKKKKLKLNISPIVVDTFQVLNNHMWLVATSLDYKYTEHFKSHSLLDMNATETEKPSVQGLVLSKGSVRVDY